MKLFLLKLVCLFLLQTLTKCQYEPNWDSIDSRPLPKWFDESKIGIFLHWGVYSEPGIGSEWIWAYWRGGNEEITNYMKKNYKEDFTYQDFAAEFGAELYNPSKWAEIFQASGAKYVVLTSKHHEGYTLWPSEYSWNWNSVDVGPRRDLIGDLAKAIRNNTEMHLGLYYSLYEWYNPLYNFDKRNDFTTQKYVQSKMIPEMVDMVLSYEPEVIWVDGDWEAPDTYFNSTNFLAWLYNDSPVNGTVVVNDRWGINMPCHHGGFYTCEDRFNPGVLQNRKWEATLTLDKESWGYRRTTQLDMIMDIEEVIATLVQSVSCGGNVLINVGPTGDGRIIPIFEERLRQVGKWLEVNGEAIYKSSPWKFQNDSLTPNVWYTQRRDLNTTYAILLEWPDSSDLWLHFPMTLDPKDTEITMLGLESTVSWAAFPSGLVKIKMPTVTPKTDPSKWAWVLKIRQKMTNNV